MGENNTNIFYHVALWKCTWISVWSLCIKKCVVFFLGLELFFQGKLELDFPTWGVSKRERRERADFILNSCFNATVPKWLAKLLSKGLNNWGTTTAKWQRNGETARMELAGTGGKPLIPFVSQASNQHTFLSSYSFSIISFLLSTSFPVSFRKATTS